MKYSTDVDNIYLYIGVLCKILLVTQTLMITGPLFIETSNKAFLLGMIILHFTNDTVTLTLCGVLTSVIVGTIASVLRKA